LRAKESGLKLGFLVLAIALIGASLTQPSLAKTLHAQHAHQAGAKGQISVKGDGAAHDAAHAPTATGADSGDEVTAPSRAGLPGDRPRPPNVNAKTGAPGTLQVRREAVPGPSEAIPRNSIGVAVAPRKDVTASGGESLRPPPPLVAPGEPADHLNGGAFPGGSDIERRSQRPVTTASIPSFGKIEGAGLIRPAVAPSGLGGPAKVVSGINGTTLRSKH
jgi:hypothetical protein